jgi:hypothetical protein
VENRPVRFAGLVADDQLVGADAQRQLAHQFIETARRFDGGGNARDIAIKGVQRGGMFGAQGAFCESKRSANTLTRGVKL